MSGGIVKAGAAGLKSVLVFSYGLTTLFMYMVIAIRAGYFFSRPSEKERLELQLARDRLWNLSRDYYGLTHHFVTLHNGFRFHYLSNAEAETSSSSSSTFSTPAPKPLIILIHGFPDSWAVWRYVVASESLQKTANIVAVDLPGYGGSDDLDTYSATNVLENLANFIIAVRTKYGIDTNDAAGLNRTVVVGHDWGCVLSMRLAAEAPELADRFILSNGPLLRLAVSNFQRILSSSSKMLKTSLPSPIRSRSTLIKAVKSLKPVLRQMYLSGYVFAMWLPMAFVRYLGTGGNRSFLRMAHKLSYGDDSFSEFDAGECMASTLGPSKDECKTQTASGEGYPTSVKMERSISNFHHMASYYRQSAASTRWQKSVETVASLHSISQGNGLRHASSGTGMFDNAPAGALKASSTIIWGKDDIALQPQLCLDGISDYLASHSQTIELPRSGHFTPIERESRVALAKAAEWAAKGEREDIGAVISASYPKSTVTVRK